jgi:hypothetical protein
MILRWLLCGNGFSKNRCRVNPFVDLEEVFEILDITHVKGLWEKSINVYPLGEHDRSKTFDDSVFAGEAGIVVEMINQLIGT